MRLLKGSLLILLTVFFVACSPSGPSNENTDFLNVADLLALEGIQECSWNFAGDDHMGVFPTEGNFLIDNGEYSFENSVHDSLDITQSTYYNGVNFFVWNDQQVVGRPQIITKMKPEVYEASVLQNIGYKVYFKMIPDWDYGITCEEVAAVTLIEPPVTEGLIEI